ncbi:unnamed protein product [Gongylonema pulchrum]|uniref:DUF2179 domain-containing protein n=1 Tax=Gongylonema pulchrum TaxID=637853 RepID=A0A183DRV4_9BILA|nr:unnamed protein product [Gongylonema pulchrum]
MIFVYLDVKPEVQPLLEKGVIKTVLIDAFDSLSRSLGSNLETVETDISTNADAEEYTAKHRSWSTKSPN